MLSLGVGTASDPGGLIRFEAVPAARSGHVHLDQAVFDAHRVTVQGSRGRGAYDLAGQIEARTVAGALEAAFFRVPMDRAAQVRAGARQGQKGTATKAATPRSGQTRAAKTGSRWSRSSWKPWKYHGALAGLGLSAEFAWARSGASQTMATRSTKAISDRPRPPREAGAAGRRRPAGWRWRGGCCGQNDRRGLPG